MRTKGNMKSKHLLLFLVTCLLLYLSDIFAGSLIALALIFQLNLLYCCIPLTQKSQVTAFKMFACTIPLFLFLGGIHSFVLLYLAEEQWLFFIFAISITYFLCFLVDFFCFFTFSYLITNQFNISATYQAAFMEVKKNKKALFLQSFLILAFTFIPYLATEWKIIFSLTVFQIYFHRTQLKQGFGF